MISNVEVNIYTCSIPAPCDDDYISILKVAINKIILPCDIHRSHRSKTYKTFQLQGPNFSNSEIPM